MRFKSVRCDECGRIQDGANHWVKIYLWDAENSGLKAIAMGDLADHLSLMRVTPALDTQIHDLCGQGCAMKHIAKLLGWSSVLEAGKD